MFNGSFAALVTPFDESGKIDEKSLRNITKWHIEQGTHGLVPVGTTGESPVLSGQEHKTVIDIVCNEVSGLIPIIAGAGSNNTKEAIDLTISAKKSGADAVLHVGGYYNRPSQEGLYQHFRAIHEAGGMPIFIYNIPSRAIVDILPKTMSRLALLSSVIGVKDATGNLARPLQERALIEKDNYYFLSGDDPTAVSYNANGGNGCISVTANIVPAKCAKMQEAMFNGNYRDALDIQRELLPLHDALFIEPSPAGVKYATYRLGLISSDYCRLPIVPLKESTKKIIDNILVKLDLI